MDVTSQLNLEREAGMGENTERQPVEPASAGVGSGAGRAGPRGRGAGGPRGPRPARGGPASALRLPPSSPAPGLASLPAAAPALCCASSPARYMPVCFPQKTNVPNNKRKAADTPNRPPTCFRCFRSLLG